MTSKQILPAVIIPLVAWRVYSRLRRNIGRQPLNPHKLKLSIGIFSALVLLLAIGNYQHLPVLGSLFGGLAVSVAIARYALHLTQFEDTSAGKFYTPNTALGVGISALFLGRLAYRVLEAYSFHRPGEMPAPPDFHSPLTYFLFGLSAGYFIAYQAGVLIRSHRSTLLVP